MIGKTLCRVASLEELRELNKASMGDIMVTNFSSSRSSPGSKVIFMLQWLLTKPRRSLSSFHTFTKMWIICTSVHLCRKKYPTIHTQVSNDSPSCFAVPRNAEGEPFHQETFSIWAHS